MSCCCSKTYNVNKVKPVHHDHQNNDVDVEAVRYGRRNGWSCPLNPLQFIGWFFIILFAITHFAILIFYLPLAWQPAGAIIPACGYIIHFVYHILALTLDPADPAVRKKGIFIKRSFNRKKQSHVIENSYCYICQTEVSSTSKHCSVCNKCISDFDHHCKWLNNCVGGRNYKLFLGSCFSGWVTAFIMFVFDLYLIIAYYSDHSNVLLDAGRSPTDWRLFVSTCKEAYIIFTIVNACLLVIAMILLGHLLIFHGYLLCHNMSTYEYIVHERQKATMQASDIESAGEPDPPKIQSPLTSNHHEENIYMETNHKATYELQNMGPQYDNIKLDDGRESRTSRDKLLIEEKQYENTTTYNNYETPLPGQIEETVDGPTAESKKKRRLKHRTSSKMQLLNSDDDLSSAASPTPSHHSHESLDSELERYKRSKDETVLEDFSSPKVGRLSSRARPSKLVEETVQTRNESVVSRPRSPSPLPLVDLQQQLDRDFVINGHGKASMSSLSTLHLQEPPEETIPSPSLTSRSSPTQQNSIHSRLSSTRLLSPLQEDSSTKGECLEASVLVEDARIATPTPSLSGQPVYGWQEKNVIPSSANGSLKSQLSSPQSLSNANRVYVTQDGREIQPRNHSMSSSSTLVGINEKISEEQGLLSSPLSTHTKLTGGVPDDVNSTQADDPSACFTSSGVPPDEAKHPDEINTHDLTVSNINTDSEDTLVFEDEFINISEQNSDFLHQSVLAANANIKEEERRKKLSRSPNAFTMNQTYDQSGGISDAESAKILPYVDAFKRKRDSSQFSFGSDSGESGPPLIATLNEEADTYALKDSLQRVKKLSDAFPNAIDSDKLKKRSLPHPKFKTAESMSEISVVEYNRKKKLKKKRPGSSIVDGKKSNLPPLTGRLPLPDVAEENQKE